ncbi:MAG: ABC transporter ATP-binding protein [Thermofilaceae archaeon]
MAVIELNDVYFRYQGSDEYALRGVTLSADRGEFIVLVGPSGCGKSTLLRVLNGLIPHFYEGEFRGEARVAGLDVKRTPTHILARHVGMVFQDPENQLFLSSVEREIAFGLENMGLPRSEVKRRVEEALRLFGLEELRDKAPYELSGGQQQKVAIASVMVLEPEVLAMDEPTANLDPLSALEILSLVRRLVDERKIVAIVVEHRMELALKFATRLIAMVRGEIVVDDEPHAAVDKVLGLVGAPPVVLAHELLKRRGLVQGYPPLTPEDLSKEVVEVIRRWRR